MRNQPERMYVNDFDKSYRRTLGTVIALWAFSALISLTFTGVVIWAIIALVSHITAGG